MRRNGYGSILVEGGSTACGYGDETGLGFAGRLSRDCMLYNARPPHRRGPARFMTFNNYAWPDKLLPDLVSRLADHASEVHIYPGRQHALVGIFVVSHRLEALDAYRGREATRQVWKSALEKLEEICIQQAIHPILVGVPSPTEYATRLDGLAYDYGLHAALEYYTRRTAESFESPYISFADMVGGETAVAGCLAPDGKHPNALGHERMAACLGGIIAREFAWPAACEQSDIAGSG